MSFSSETKNELARITTEKKCCQLAEIAGFIRVAGSVGLQGGGKLSLMITTENPAVARHFRKLMKEYFKVEASVGVGQGNTLKKGKYYVIKIGPEQKSEQILRETGMLMVREGMNYITDGIYSGIIRTKCCRKSYLRGAFLGAGTMTDPEKGYQFEIVCRTEALSQDLKKLINTFVDIHAKTVQRKGNCITYVKGSEQIKDILAIMGAHSQYLHYEDVRLIKELRNEANRRANCDQANIDRAVTTGLKQQADIIKIRDTIGLDALPPKLRLAAELRLSHPEASIAELGQMLDPPLKKSGMNNRLKKIAEIAERQK